MAKTTLYNFSESDRRGLQGFINRVENHLKHATPNTHLQRTQFDKTTYTVRLTGRGNVVGSFKFREVKFDSATNNFIDKPQGITESDAGHAFDVTGSTTIPIGAVVTIAPDYSRRGNGVAVYVFDYPSKYIWAKLTGASLITANKWRYSWTEQVFSSGQFRTPDSPLTGTTSEGFALNSLEANNTASGIQGNGINVSNLNDGFELLPASTGNPTLQLYEIMDGENRVYLFTLANAIDGECS